VQAPHGGLAGRLAAGHLILDPRRVLRPIPALDSPVEPAVGGAAGSPSSPADARGPARYPTRPVACAVPCECLNAKERPMCRKCDEGIQQTHSSSRRDFLKATAATGAAAAAARADLFAPRPAAARDGDSPQDTGRRGRRYIIRGGAVMTM